MWKTIVYTLILSGCIACQKNQMKTTFNRDAIPPVAEKKEHLRTIHGDTVNDSYYWMYDY